MSGFLTPFQASEITSPLSTPIKKQQEITMAASVSFVNLTAYWFTIQDRQGNIISHIAPNSSGADNFPEVIRDMVIINRDTTLTLQDNGNEANIFRLRFNNQAASEGISNNASITNNLVTLASGLPAGANDIGKVHLLDSTGTQIGADGQHNLLVGLRNSAGVEPSITTLGSDGNASVASLGTFDYPMLFNEGGWDRQRANTQGTLLASGARTASTSSAIQTNYNAKGLQVILTVYTASGTGGLKANIKGIGSTGTTTYWMNPQPTAVTATGKYIYEMYPYGSPVTSGDITQRTTGILPRTWGVDIVALDSSSYTYQLEYALIL